MIRTTLLLLLMCSNLIAQQITTSKNSLSSQFAHFIPDNYDGSAATFFDDHKTQMGLSEHDNFVMTSEQAGMNGTIHYRYKQYHQEIKIFGASYVIHEKNGKVKYANGKILPKIDMEVTPTLTPSEALDYAMNDMQASLYSWQVKSRNPNNKVPIPELVIVDKSVTSFTGAYRLAYEIELHSIQPLDAYVYLVDAHTGYVIKRITRHHGNGVPGRGVTKYYGEQSITVDSISPERFELHDPTRGDNGINVTDESLENFTSNSSFFDLTNEDQNEVAVDALYLTSELYDELIEEFAWTGLDNEDRSFNVIVHANDGADFINAFWDGQFANFGNGDCNHGPLTTHEVLAHEFMHGIIDFTSELIYADESGAINESMADVLGQYMEWIGDRENFSWNLGHSFQLRDDLPQFRVMDDPNSVQNPAYYRGEYWMDGGGVHTNSAIGNLFYVLLSDGGSGIANGEVPYDVNGIGIEEAAKFLFFVNRHYLTESSGYNDYYTASIEAAEEFFGGDMAIIEDIQQAWAAVGLPTIQGGGDDVRLSIFTNGFDIVCGTDGFASLEITVSNDGVMPYVGGQGGNIAILKDFALVDRIPIVDDILPGESLELVLDSLIELDDDFIFVDVELRDIPNNVGVEEDLAIFIVNEFESDDLELSFDLEASPCFSDSIHVTYRVRNNSCNTLSAGSSFDLVLEEAYGDLIHIENVVLDRPLFSRASRIYDIAINFEPQQSTDLQASISYDADPDMDNNIDFGEIQYSEPIELGYLNEFNEFADLARGLQLNSNSLDFLTNFENSSVFFTSGFFEDVDEPLCFEAERNFQGEPSIFSPITAIIRGCVDATGVSTPALSFDLVQYRNDVSDFVSDASSSLQVLVRDDNEDVVYSEVILGQTEGELENHIVGLPSDYMGAIELRFVTQSGSDLFSPDFLDYDVVMLDNLMLSQTTSTDDVDEIDDFTVYPNPATNHIHINSDIQFAKLDVIDAQGIRVISTLRPGDELDVSLLDAGFYIINALDSDNKEYKSAFTKI